MRMQDIMVWILLQLMTASIQQPEQATLHTAWSNPDRSSKAGSTVQGSCWVPTAVLGSHVVF
jgi:hypothetical protein